MRLRGFLWGVFYLGDTGALLSGSQLKRPGLGAFNTLDRKSFEGVERGPLVANISSNKLGNNGGRFYNFMNKPVMMDCEFTVAAADAGGLGITGLKGNAVQNIFMHTSQTAGKGANGYLNPNPLAGYALIQLANNYAALGGINAYSISPLTGSDLAINATALTARTPYQITAVGAAPKGTVTIAPVADVSGSLASTYFMLYDAYGQTFAIWFSVDGVGKAPKLDPGIILVQQSITAGQSAANIGTALDVTIAALPSSIAGVYSFTSTGTTTVTVVSTAAGPLPGAPMEGLIATGFTFAVTVYNTNNQCWEGVGLPKGLVPTVGQAFIATATGFATGGGSSGKVKAIGEAGICAVEMIGSASNMLAPIPMGGSPNVGGFIIVKFLAPSIPVTSGTAGNAVTLNAGTTLEATAGGAIAGTFAAAAPADGSIIKLSFVVE